MSIIHTTDQFDEWLDNLKDKRTEKRIKARIRRAEAGNFGDVDSVGDGVYEMRLHFGPGYRLYYCQRDNEIYWLLIGGAKSTQVNDVERAKEIKNELERSEAW